MSDLDQLLECLIDEHTFISEYRVHNLVYLAELLYVERTDGTRFSDVSFKPYRYGMYSDELRDTLNKISTQDQISTDEYTCDSCVYKSSRTKEDSEDVGKLVKVVIDLSRHLSDDELAECVKSSFLFSETGYNETVNFTQYSVYLKTSKSDWKTLLK